jgi:radical SAM protein with 4Fe4S-binding SPASM domain
MELRTESVNGHYLVSRPSTGAVSLFSPAEYLVFMCIRESQGQDPAMVIRRVMNSYDCTDDQISRFTGVFLKKLVKQGWMRTQREDVDPQSVQCVYLSVTTGCNLACKYCYIGDERRTTDHRMSINDALLILDKITAYNPNSNLAVTGGEPFTHPGIFGILDAIEHREIHFSLGSNAVLIDEEVAQHLKRYRFLHHVQVSIDGMTPDVHAITRGDTWDATMRGIRNLIGNKVPFSLAPTLHSLNLHQVADIARFALDNGGSYSPNHLRHFPHAHHAGEVSLSPGELRNSIILTSREVPLEGGTETGAGDIQEARQQARCRYVCGNAWYSIDIDWNGDVYPCHLLREKEFVLGNLLTEELPVIMNRGKNSKTRVRAYDIPKCKLCPFVATCAGGCRASAYYNKGTLAGEEEFCEILYKFEVDKLFHAKNIPSL